jgi:hypothetical protein
MLGRHQEELVVARQCKSVFPEELPCRAEEARALAALGRMDELEAMLHEATTVAAQADSTATMGSWVPGDVFAVAVRELRAHGYRQESLAIAERLVDWSTGFGQTEDLSIQHRDSVASALYLAERWSEAEEIYRTLGSDEVNRVDNWDDLFRMEFRGMLGVTAARNGNRAAALKISDELARVEGYPLGRHTRFRASIAAILGEKQQALDLLRQAIAQGRTLHNPWGGIHDNPDFEALWDDPEFKELMRPKG